MGYLMDACGELPITALASKVAPAYSASAGGHEEFANVTVTVSTLGVGEFATGVSGEFMSDLVQRPPSSGKRVSRTSSLPGWSDRSSLPLPHSFH